MSETVDQNSTNEEERESSQMNAFSSIVGAESPKELLATLSAANAAGLVIEVKDLSRSLTELKNISLWLSEPGMKDRIAEERAMGHAVTYDDLEATSSVPKTAKPVADVVVQDKK